MKKLLSIGIDPGKVTGVAIAEDGVLQSLESTDFWGAFYTVKHFAEMCKYNVDFEKDVLVVIEVPTTKANWHGPKASHDVGRVCRESELLAEGIKKLGATVITQHPQGKLNQEQFARITGWTKRTNQHCRDAGMLAYGAKHETR